MFDSDGDGILVSDEGLEEFSLTLDSRATDSEHDDDGSHPFWPAAQV
jgi:hypothetical protein